MNAIWDFIVWAWETINGFSFAQALITVVGITLLMTTVLLIIVRGLTSFAPHLRGASTQNVMEVSLTIVGTLASVVMAFILFAVWNRFEQAKTLCDQESAEVMVIYRLSKGLPERNRRELKETLRNYVFRACFYDWNMMNDPKNTRRILKNIQNNVHDKDTDKYVAEERRLKNLEASGDKEQFLKELSDHVGITDTASNGKNDEMDKTLASFWDNVEKIKTSGDQPKPGIADSSLKDKITDHLANLSSLRSQRLVMSQTQLPVQIWAVLVFAAIVMTIAICLVWVERFDLHLFNALLLAGMVSLVLETTSQIDNPFQGDVRVKPVGLMYSMQLIDTDKDAEKDAKKSVSMPPSSPRKPAQTGKVQKQAQPKQTGEAH